MVSSKITCLFLATSLVVTLCASPPHGSAAEDPLVDCVKPFVDSHSLSGAVMLVADDQKILDLQSVGFADIGRKKRMANDDLFWIASESKPIAATAIMILVDEGKVHLDDPVERYLPEFRNLWVRVEESGDHLLLKRPKHPITLREVLSHTSGMRPTSALEHPTFDLLPLKFAVESYAMTPLDAEPGSKYNYANSGINTAGRIVEVVSGMPYEKFLQKRIFDPLGMKDTTFRPTRQQVARLAKSYRPDASKKDLVEIPISQVRYPLDDPSRYPFPAGGLFSTASDMAKFAQMILNGGLIGGGSAGKSRLLTESSVHEMTRKQTGDSINVPYGLGWAAGEVFGHGGAYSTNLVIDSKRKLILIWMVQQEGFANNGSQSFGAFQKVALATFGKAP